MLLSYKFTHIIYLLYIFLYIQFNILFFLIYFDDIFYP